MEEARRNRRDIDVKAAREVELEEEVRALKGEGLMLKVTDEARAYLARILSVEPGAGRVLRLCVDGEHLRLATDSLRSDDAAFEHQGRIVLAVGTDVARLLQSRTLRLQPTELGTLLAVE